jgi:hypothetical protein
VVGKGVVMWKGGKVMGGCVVGWIIESGAVPLLAVIDFHSGVEPSQGWYPLAVIGYLNCVVVF